MYCKNCGAELSNAAPQCPSCGQPQHAAPPTSQQPEPNTALLLIAAILVTLLCCMPPGIVSIVYAALAMGRQHTEPDVAARYARSAKIWAWVGFGIGLASWLLYVLLFVVMGIGAAAASGNSP